MKPWMVILGAVGLLLTVGVLTVWVTGDPKCLLMKCVLVK